MPKKRYALEREGPLRLELSWKAMFKDVQVSLDDDPVGTIPDRKALTEGRQLKLPDGSLLDVRLQSGLFSNGIELARDGTPLPGSHSDPETVVRGAGTILYLVAGLNALAGFAVMLFDVPWLARLTGEGGVGALLLATFYALLGFLTSRGSRLALVLAIVIFGLDAVSGVVMTVGSGERPSIGGLLVRIFLISFLVRALPAAKALKQRRQGRPE